jgi:tRNA A-37 threonylcarbamoyl transferase component Bud32/tetratricopeptide (TPR) repeat protein
VADLRSRLAAALAGRYVIEREVGSGGAAIVYLARDLKHGRAVAVKVLRPELGASLGAERFLREIRIAAGLTHPHILAVHDSGEADGLLYYVMPYVEGESLRERLRREGPLPVDEALRIAREVADALSYAHSQGVVHRDIKPGNILLVGGHAVVADFGIAVAAGVESDALTELGLAIGTPAYMSPEQGGSAGPIDGRTDLYSLGCVLYEMLTGSPPFTGPSPQAVLARHASDRPSPVRMARPSIPTSVDAAVGRALSKLPADRFPTAQQFAEALGGVAAAAGHPPARSRLRRAGVAVALAAALAVLAVAVMRGRTGGNRDAAAGLTVVVLPFSGDTLSSSTGRGEIESLLRGALEWLPGVSAMDGRDIAETSPEWRSGDLAGVFRRATGLGAKYLLVTGSQNAGAGLRLTAELYRAGDGQRIVKAEQSVGSDSLGSGVDRLARDVLGPLAERERLLANDRAWVLAATPSARALGRLIQGQAAFERSEFDEAAAAFAQAVEADSDCGLCYHRLSTAHEWRHDFSASMAAALAGLARQPRLRPHSADLLNAQRYYMMGQGDSAIAAFQELVLDRPEASDGWLGLAESLFHYAGYSGHRATDSRAAFVRLYALDSMVAAVTAYHLVDLAVGDSQPKEARAWLDRMPGGHPWRVMRESALALRFGDTASRRVALEQLGRGPRQALTQLVQVWMHGPLDATVADTLATLLMTPLATPADRLRGAQYRLAALAAEDRWSEALAAWRAARSDRPFDAWIVQATFAGFPADSVARPMFAYAERLVASGRSPDFRQPPWDPLLEPFFALVHRAAVSGDSAGVQRLLDRIATTPAEAQAPYPMEASLRAALEARLALLAADTGAAVAALRRAVSRVHGPGDGFFPMTSMAPERLQLATLLAATGDRAAAEQWLESFSETWAVADAMFTPRARALLAHLKVSPSPPPAERSQ